MRMSSHWLINCTKSSLLNFAYIGSGHWMHCFLAPCSGVWCMSSVTPLKERENLRFNWLFFLIYIFILYIFGDSCFLWWANKWDKYECLISATTNKLHSLYHVWTSSSPTQWQQKPGWSDPTLRRQAGPHTCQELRHKWNGIFCMYPAAVLH